MRKRLFALPLLVALFGCSSSSDDNKSSGTPLTCVPQIAKPELDSKRASCGFDAPAKVSDTIGFTAEMRKKMPIDHIIVMMKENRSFDHLFGQLSKAGLPDIEPVPDNFTNPDPNGAPVARYHETKTCLDADPNHQWDAMHNMVDGGKMDGFVKSAAATTTTSTNTGLDGHFVMGYFDQTDLPFYYFLATTFATADHYFPSVLSGTWPNRDYLYAATSDGVRETLPSSGPAFPSVPTIFDALDDAKIEWGIYFTLFPLEGALGITNPRAKQIQAFFDAVSSGTLPPVSFVDGSGNKEDDHPPADLHVSEDWSYKIYDAIAKSPYWKSSVIFYTYDEAGGFADHVPPPQACVARPQDSDFHELGVRVAATVISPYAKRNYVSHIEHQHTSILRFIELMYDLPAFTARDANSDAMLDMFDFCSDPATVPDAPKAGSGGCP